MSSKVKIGTPCEVEGCDAEFGCVDRVPDFTLFFEEGWRLYDDQIGGKFRVMCPTHAKMDAPKFKLLAESIPA